MYNMNPYASYKNRDLETNTKYELVGRLYGGAAICLKMAAMDIGNKKYDSVSNEIIKAQKIVMCLKGALDMRYGVSGGLNSLYEYMYRRLLEANVKKDPAILQEISGLLIELRDAWNEAMKTYKKTQTLESGTF